MNINLRKWILPTFFCLNIFFNVAFAYPKFDLPRLSFLTFRLNDVNYLSFELAYLGEKKYKDYPFYSYAGAYAANLHTTRADSLEGSVSRDSVNCAVLAAKGGVIAPISKRIGFMLFGSLSLGITAVAEAPWLGSNDDRIDDPTLIGYELGLLFHHKQLVTKLTYYGTNVKFLPGAVTFSFGVNF